MKQDYVSYFISYKNTNLSRSKWWIEVCIFRSIQGFRRILNDTFPNLPPFDDANACFLIAPDGPMEVDGKYGRNKLGLVCFHQQDLSGRVIAHEATHVAIEYFIKTGSMLPDTFIHSRSGGRWNDHYGMEEELALAVGDIAGQIHELLWKFGKKDGIRGPWNPRRNRA